jgi:glutamate N-acetyltransferase/amino-acid N-acetyltransferase
VKTALYGQELNWGRIICAAGYSGVAFNPERIMLSICGVTVFRGGSPVVSGKIRAERALRAHDVKIGIDLGEGKHEARVFTCDLSREYVDINASYIS